MLQDLEYGRLENEFRHTAPVATAKVVCAQGSRLLVRRKEDDTLVLPTYAEVMAWAKEKGWTHWYENEVQYVFRMQEEDYFICSLTSFVICSPPCAIHCSTNVSK